MSQQEKTDYNIFVVGDRTVRDFVVNGSVKRSVGKYNFNIVHNDRGLREKIKPIPDGIIIGYNNATQPFSPQANEFLALLTFARAFYSESKILVVEYNKTSPQPIQNVGEYSLYSTNFSKNDNKCYTHFVPNYIDESDGGGNSSKIIGITVGVVAVGVTIAGIVYKFKKSPN
jgi:hypothetical protein